MIYCSTPFTFENNTLLLINKTWMCTSFRMISYPLKVFYICKTQNSLNYKIDVLILILNRSGKCRFISFTSEYAPRI